MLHVGSNKGMSFKKEISPVPHVPSVTVLPGHPSIDPSLNTWTLDQHLTSLCPLSLHLVLDYSADQDQTHGNTAIY